MRKLPALIALLLSFNAHAQVEGSTWYFGEEAGLRFSECSVTVLTNGASPGFEGCATISNAVQGMLFYTNSATVWNRQHQPMPNGSLVPSGGTLSQVLIVKRPLSDSLYYIITTRIQGQGTEFLKYHVVDLSLAGGLGDVSSANNVLTTDNVTETVTATRHTNGTDVWIVSHGYPSNTFQAWLLTSSGIAPTPVISNVGPAFVPCNSNVNARGELKFSLDGTRIGLAGGGTGNEPNTDMLAVFNFDANTGVVSNALALPPLRGDFAVSFSPDGTKLYGATWKALNFFSTDSNYVYQYDLSSGDSTTIANSLTILWSSTVSESYGSLQLAPDGRIYSARNNSGHLGVINDPDLPGSACNYVHNGLFLAGKTGRFGLNNFIQYVDCSLATSVTDVPITLNEFFVHADPGSGSITIGGAALAPGTAVGLRIMDAAGRIALNIPRMSGSTFNATELPAGVYVATVLNARNERTASRAFVWCP